MKIAVRATIVWQWRTLSCLTCFVGANIVVMQDEATFFVVFPHYIEDIFCYIPFAINSSSIFQMNGCVVSLSVSTPVTMLHFLFNLFHSSITIFITGGRATSNFYESIANSLMVHI